MHVTIITAFPNFFERFLETGVIGKAIDKGLLRVSLTDLRDFGLGNYRQMDDYTFGGGGGMVLLPEVLESALHSARAPFEGKGYVVCPSPQGDLLSQEVVETLAAQEHVVIVCGRYEGIDERFIAKHVHREISLGDFVLTGGEIPAMAMVDAVARLVPGVVGRESSVEEDSFYRGMLDHSHFTRPSEWSGMETPSVLLSGDAAEIERWRRDDAAERTILRRPDLVARANIRPYLPAGVYVALVHHPVLDRRGERSTTAVTGLDLSDIARSCRTYGVDRFFVVTPLASQRELVQTMRRHWTEGGGAAVSPERSEAMRLIKTVSSVERALEWVTKREKLAPTLIGTSAKDTPGSFHWLEAKRRVLREGRPVLFIFGTGSGLHEEVLSLCTICLSPLSGGMDGFNHLSVRTAAGTVLDRFFGWR
ncbi:MAG: tRNA (guanosine(37)-N1)-methyltransferase TrmD [Synergistaceae bacterium]|nr:tRNA (guanosine(37)-N1)-methyltransferase TrmD [Synergistota bacterium]NLM72047.1 tRNA (guanosine(37)-N1)-methyltransferase TrmD [Synergistaceae bacterium]